MRSTDLTKHGLACRRARSRGLRRRIEDLRRSAETTLDADMRQRLGSALDQAADAVERWPLHTLTFEAVADQLSRFYREARRLLPAHWPSAEGEELHELRKRVVIHRYQIDLIEPLWPRFVKVWSGETQRLRDRLGKHQDTLVLASLTVPHGPLAPWRSRLADAHRGAAGRACRRAPPASPRASSWRSRARCAGGSPRCGRSGVEANGCLPGAKSVQIELRFRSK